MGTKSSRPSQASAAEVKVKDDSAAAASNSKMTETEMDSIQVSEVILPVHGKVFHVNLGLVNSIQEEMERIILTYRLNIPASECQLVIHEGEGSGKVMDRDLHIEYYKDILTSTCTSVQLIHNPPPAQNGEPNLGSLGVAMR